MMLERLVVMESPFGLSVKAGDMEEVMFINKMGATPAADLRRMAAQMAAGPRLARVLASLVALAQEAIVQREASDDAGDVAALPLFRADVDDADVLLQELRAEGAV